MWLPPVIVSATATINGHRKHLPWQGNAVRFLHSPALLCDNGALVIARSSPNDRACPPPRAKNRSGSGDLLHQLVHACCRAAAGIAQLIVIGLLVSPDAALYQFRKSPASDSSSKARKCWLGMDDYCARRIIAFAKRRNLRDSHRPFNPERRSILPLGENNW